MPKFTAYYNEARGIEIEAKNERHAHQIFVLGEWRDEDSFPEIDHGPLLTRIERETATEIDLDAAKKASIA